MIIETNQCEINEIFPEIAIMEEKSTDRISTVMKVTITIVETPTADDIVKTLMPGA